MAGTGDGFAAALTQSHSRLGFAMAIVGSALFVILTPGKITNRLKRPLLTALGCTAILGIVAVASPELWARFIDLSRTDLIQRDDLWMTALRAISERPITGWGQMALLLSLLISPPRI